MGLTPQGEVGRGAAARDGASPSGAPPGERLPGAASPTEVPLGRPPQCEGSQGTAAQTGPLPVGPPPGEALAGARLPGATRQTGAPPNRIPPDKGSASGALRNPAVPGGSPLLEVRGLSIGHRGVALARDISFAVHPGEVLVLLGPNGAGKTTLFRTLLGLLPPLAGAVRLGGRDLARLSRVEVARLAALVPQALAAPFAFTALDVVLMARTARLAAFARPGSRDRAAALAALERTGIGALAGQPVTTLSGGQRQLVLIARALAQETPLLILDEPAASLDWGNRLRLLQRLRQLAGEGLALVLSTHDPGHAARLAGRVLTIDAQGATWQGSPAQALDPARLARLYNLPPELAAEAPDLPRPAPDRES